MFLLFNIYKMFHEWCYLSSNFSRLPSWHSRSSLILHHSFHTGLINQTYEIECFEFVADHDEKPDDIGPTRSGNVKFRQPEKNPCIEAVSWLYRWNTDSMPWVPLCWEPLYQAYWCWVCWCLSFTNLNVIECRYTELHSVSLCRVCLCWAPQMPWMRSVLILSHYYGFIFYECHCDVCAYVECHHTPCCNHEHLDIVCHYAQCCYAVCLCWVCWCLFWVS
jgi:hypothetical protein